MKLMKLQVCATMLGPDTISLQENYVQLLAGVSHPVFILASETLSALMTYLTVVFRSHVFLK